MKILPTEAARSATSATTIASASPAVPTSSGPGAGPASSRVAGPEPGAFARLLGKLGREVDRGEKTMGAAMAGRGVHDPAALLALQAGIYRYVEAVDLASKLIDRAANAVKTTLQSQ